MAITTLADILHAVSDSTMFVGSSKIELLTEAEVLSYLAEPVIIQPGVGYDVEVWKAGLRQLEDLEVSEMRVFAN